MEYGELIEVESVQSPAEVADVLRSVADALDAGEELTVEGGGESVTVAAPTDQLEFEVELEREPGDGGPDELELEFELEWDDVASEETASLTVEGEDAAGDGESSADDDSVEET